MKIEIDDGFSFGLGVFETIAIRDGKLLLLDEHLARMEDGAARLGIKNAAYDSATLKDRANREIKNSQREQGALKITLTNENIIFTQRDNPYTEEAYQKGFVTKISPIRRNETSPFTYVKSLNYGDNIMEKRRAHREDFDEPIFLNSTGQLTEGATTNLFLVMDGQIYTPPVSCGLLNGIQRQYVMKNNSVKEKILYPEDAYCADEMFLTNSLLGIMKVRQFEDRIYSDNQLKISL